MVSSEVQRTLVKSPPELWAELSDPAALARHLSELGDIRITRTQPESTVEWAADNVTGTVSIQASGWGTKVTLNVTREMGLEAADADADAVFTAQPLDAEPAADAAAPAPTTQAAPAADAEPAATGSHAEPDVQHTPRRGFFARLFRRRDRVAPAPEEHQDEQPDAFAAVREAIAPDAFTKLHPFATTTPPAPARSPMRAGPPGAPAPTPTASLQADPNAKPEAVAEEPSDISAELMAAEEVTAEEVTAVLTAVLDRLGAAHHRPFSRA